MKKLLGIFTSTRFRITFLRWLSFPIIAYFKLVHGTTVILAKREGVIWELDLTEAIDMCLWLGCFETDVASSFKKHLSKGMIALDIGANRGAHTMLMAQLVGATGHVHAIEATAWGVSKIKRLLELNPELSARITVHHAFLLSADESAPQEISASWSIREGMDDPRRNALDQGFSKPLLEAQALGLDDWTRNNKMDRIDVIKLDVDGNEVSILRGAQESLRSLRPLIFMELSPIHFVGHRHQFKDQILATLQAGYEFFTLDGARKLNDDPVQLEESIPFGTLVNVLARPYSISRKS